MKVINQKIDYKGITIAIKREDLLHPIISGNKFRKLKYNLTTAKAQNHTKLLTFGGAFSNHILAVAAAGNEYGFATIGIIRGEEIVLKINENPTLKKAKELGMQLEFVSREKYRAKDSEEFIEELKNRFGVFYLLPEGGTNELAIKGCEEILTKEDTNYNFICCAVGTGGTISGIINSAKKNQKVLGFSALNSDYLEKEIATFVQNTNWQLFLEDYFGGYGKIKPELIRFLNEFFTNYGIPLDPIYTGKLLFRIFALIDAGFFSAKDTILVIHTGGLQGIAGINQILKKKNEEIINYG